jgi:hypothetical protein
MVDDPNTDITNNDSTKAEPQPRHDNGDAVSAAGNDASQVASDAEGRTGAKTQMQARRRSAADSSVSPKSSTIQNPDAELRADLTQDVLTANREAMQAEIRAGEGSTEGLKKLQELHQAVADAQSEVDLAINKRNEARDAYDREVEAQAVGTSRPFGELIAAAHAAADRENEEAAKLRKKQLAGA